MFVFVIVHFCSVRKSSRSWISLVLGMLGVVVICVGSAGQPDTAGVMIALLSGLPDLHGKPAVSKRVQSRHLTFLNNLVCCLILLPWVGSELSISLKEIRIVAVMGVVQLGIPLLVFPRLGADFFQEASLIVLIEPVLNPIWVALIGELPSGATLVGGLCIVGSLAFRYLRQAPK